MAEDLSAVELPRVTLDETQPWDVIVIGAGAAGLMAAAEAAQRGRRTLLLEKNRRPGVKILISGGTRCNLTQATDKRGIVQAYREQGSFLHSALALLGPADLVKIVEDEGVPTKREETGKIFPVSDRAVDVLAAFVNRFRRSGATMSTEQTVERVDCDGEQFVVVTNGKSLRTTSVLITSGGKSYPGCGTTGDGYAWAEGLGHRIIPTRPALVPITTNEPWVLKLSGLTLPDIVLRIAGEPDRVREAGGEANLGKKMKKKSPWLDERRGSLLFTHFGLSGPVVLDISRTVTGHSQPTSLDVVCDFVPDIRAEDLDAGIREQCLAAGKKQVGGVLQKWIPHRLAEELFQRAGVSTEQRAAELSKASRAQLVRWIKEARIRVTGTRGFAKAEVTAGGVDLAEVDSRTMQSKLVPGLFFAGEVLDLDGPIGGYNFQAAFSTGMLAGQHV
ncbi:tricarballylate dehydrogenase [Anatilimnocola aggregata]|uniref:Tricarballylate dehydrogenase n=1 Tax=Anatilimnocola aggregata TaxID=2528021 RepID=A0A517YIL1_9BACT|nr:NAD(P)/FAD-dependent oxidoreductase [Anatilimnocola aggregata]QDU30069.1 tricarballylate dehydrogenase [Anatilimnocola aggregata]